MRNFIVILLLSLGLKAEHTLDKIPSWYYNIEDKEIQKLSFFSILLPIIKKENHAIRQERAFITQFFSNPDIYKESLSRMQRLKALAKKYRIGTLFDKERYLHKIDTIPESLVLAQAVIESGWGKSRFAKEANNLFGERTWSSEGIVPKYREEGQTYKVKTFSSISASVKSYMLNLNRHNAYYNFRESRKHHSKFDGIQASLAMNNYSEIGDEYAQIIKRVIDKNQLHKFES